MPGAPVHHGGRRAVVTEHFAERRLDQHGREVDDADAARAGSMDRACGLRTADIPTIRLPLGPSRAPSPAVSVDDPARYAAEPARTARDSRSLTHAGVTWPVTERDGRGVPGNADGARGPRCLVFASPEAVRRVWAYPPDWRTLPDAALFALSWRR